MNRPVLVVGAGLAGLNCALHLQQQGQSVRLIEASDRVGGVLRTETIDGFRIDRGFQVFQTAYPEARTTLNYPELDLRSFYPGAQLRSRGRFLRVSDPWRRPLRALLDLPGGVVSPLDALRLWRKRRRVLSMTIDELMRLPAPETRAALECEGFSRRLASHFFEPLFRGIFLEAELTTTSRLADFVFRMFVSGSVTLPASGMDAIPKQLASRLLPGTLSLNTPVARLTHTGVELENGESIAGSVTVVATDADTGAKLCPELRAPRWNSVTPVYFDAPRAPLPGAYLIMNVDDPGPVCHLAFLTEAVPEYSDRGRTLAAVTVIGIPDISDETLAQRVLAQLSGWWGEEVEPWRLLDCCRLARAIPVQSPATMAEMTRPVALSERHFVCGGHRETSSIGGALRSGRRAALAVREALAR